MHLILTLISSLALMATSVMAKEDRALSFTTWDCNNCGATGGASCHQIPHQDVTSDTCLQLEPNQNSIVVNYAIRTSCYVELYASNDCSGDGPTYNYEHNHQYCKPIPANERTSYKVTCN